MTNTLQKLLDGVEVEWKELKDIIVSLKTGLRACNHFKVNTDDADGYYVTVPEIQNGNIVFLDKTKRINTDALKIINNRSNLEIGDVLFSGVGTIGKTAVIKETPKNWNIKKDIYAIKPKHEIINPKYLAYILNSKNIIREYSKKIVGSIVKNLSMADIKRIEIPIPCPNNPKKSLEIQTRIVEILDNFTELTAQLTAELTARRKQYNYYREQLLTFKEGEVEWVSLGEVTKYEQPNKYLVKTKKYQDDCKTPVLTAGKTFILGYTDETEGIYKGYESPVIIFDDFTTSNKWVDFDFKVKSSAIKIITSNDNTKFILKYIYYCLNILLKNLINIEHQRQWISKFCKKKIPIPPIEIQNQIVNILDKFDTFTNSTSEGLLYEIELRKRQYEYYRDLLLNFPKNED